MVRKIKKTKKKSMRGGGIFKEYSLDEQTELLDKISKVYVKETHKFLKDRNKSFMKFLCEINNGWFTRDKKLKEEIDKFYNPEQDEEPLKKGHLASDEDMMYNLQADIENKNRELIFNEFFDIFKEQNKIVDLDECIILLDKSHNIDIKDFKTNGKVDLKKYIETVDHSEPPRTPSGYRSEYRTEWQAVVDYWNKLTKNNKSREVLFYDPKSTKIGSNKYKKKKKTKHKKKKKIEHKRKKSKSSQ